MTEDLRSCTQCKELKPTTHFSKKKRGPGGLDWKCKACLSADYYRLLSEDPSRVERNKQYRIEWREKNQDKIAVYNERAIQWVKDNPDYVKQWYQDNKDKRKIDSLRWQRENAQKVREYSRKRRAYKKGSGNYKILPKELRRLKSQPCFYCGSKEPVTLDHVIPLSRGGCDSIGNLLPACISCNSQKQARFIMEWRTNKVVRRQS